MAEGSRDQAARHGPHPGSLGRWVWSRLTSMRTAIVLLISLGVASIPGSLLPQRGVSSDPGAVVRFSRENPDLAPWLDRLGLFGVYSAPWFAAIYLLLLISMTGCVVPRLVRLWRAFGDDPAPPPRHLERADRYADWEPEALQAGAMVAHAQAALRRRGYRVRVDRPVPSPAATTELGSVTTVVRGEKGFLREAGNLLFHASLLVMLLGVALGSLMGYEGRVAVAEGDDFTNVISQYDDFTPSPLTDLAGLRPFSFTLNDFDAQFETVAARRGEPRSFRADLEYRSSPQAPVRTASVEPNKPLAMGSTKVFLTGHGYAPKVTVRDGGGQVAFSGPVIFMPRDSTYASDGVIKVPDATPEQLGFEGFFLPTVEMGPSGPFSLFPDDLDPRLVLTAWSGDLGLDTGIAQSVFTLEKAGMNQLRSGDQPFAFSLKPGQTAALPGRKGTITFDGVARFANLQIARDPGKEVALLAAILLLTGLTLSLTIARRRAWVVVTAPTTTARGRVQVAASAVTRRGLPREEFDQISEELRAPAEPNGRSRHSPTRSVAHQSTRHGK